MELSASFRVLLGAASTLLATVAVAQGGEAQQDQTASAIAQDQGLTEVLVTARRREESAQTVPVAVTALSADDLAERHITTGQDLQGQIPSFTVSAGGQSRDTETYSLRGQSTTYTSAPAVVQYLAEVPLIAGRTASLQGSPGQFLDLVSMQVLRGPQGTLFGRNSTGGAVLLEPAKPTDEFTGYVQLQAGNYEDREAEAVLNVPLGERLAVRFAGRYVDREGFTEDLVTGTDYDNRNYWSGRLGMLWRPSDAIENYLMVSGSRSRTSGTGWILGEVNVPLIDAVFAGFGGCAGVGLGPDCSVLTDLAAAQQGLGTREVSLGPEPLESELRGWSVIDQLSVEMSENLTLRNIFSFSKLTAFTPYDGDGTALPMYNSNLPRDGDWTDEFSQFTGEVQLQGDVLDDDLQYTAGVYYEKIESPSRTIIDNITFLGGGANTFSLDTNSKAVYAQGTYDFGGASEAWRGLKLTGGLRYTWDETKGAGSAVFYDVDGRTIVACANGVAAFATSYDDCEIQSRKRSSSPSWTAGFDYLINERVLPYAKVTHGYKTGGINLQAVNLAHTTFDPEYVTTYEVGFKSTFKAGAVPVRFNVNAFHTRYKDIQVATGDVNFDTGGAGAAVFNVASARIRGVEVEGTIRPLRDLELSANYSHLSGKYREFTIENLFGQFDCSGEFVVGTVDLRCLPMSDLPENQFSVTGRYALPVGAELGRFVLSANYAYIGEQFNTSTTPIELAPGSVFDSYGLLNLSVNWSGILQTPLEVGFFVTNATDETYRASNTGVFQQLGVQSSLYGEPRMYGVQVRYRW